MLGKQDLMECEFFVTWCPSEKGTVHINNNPPVQQVNRWWAYREKKDTKAWSMVHVLFSLNKLTKGLAATTMFN